MSGATTFDSLEFGPALSGNGIQARTEYPNGYGASIIKGEWSYGGSEGLYEVAVYKGGSLCYSTPVTDDVLGHLSEDEVSETLELIAELPAVAA